LGCAGGVEKDVGEFVNMNEDYILFLDQKRIGITKLDKADAPMGVVFGKIFFDDPTIGYDYIKDYCLNNDVYFSSDDEDRSISTYNIPRLVVVNKDGVAIKGQSTFVDGMELYEFIINIVGIPYPFYEEEFPHHVKEYNERWKNME